MKIGILGTLGVVQVTLKLTDNIDWSWWWVTLPFWIVPAVLLTWFLLALLNEMRR